MYYLTEHACIQNEHFEYTTPKGYRVLWALGAGKAFGMNPHDWAWTCTCTGFKFRKKCKHIEEAKKAQCTWDGHWDEGEVTKEGKCPRCGSDTIENTRTER